MRITKGTTAISKANKILFLTFNIARMKSFIAFMGLWVEDLNLNLNLCFKIMPKDDCL